MNIFIGRNKIQERIKNKEYYVKEEEYNGLQVDDYVFMVEPRKSIKDRVIPNLYKVLKMTPMASGIVKAEFDLITAIDSKPKSTKLVLLNCIFCNKTSLNSCVMSTPKRYFHKLNFTDNILEKLIQKGDWQELNNYIDNDNNYRKVQYFDDKSNLLSNSNDFQFYKENENIHIYAAPFIDQSLIDTFENRSFKFDDALIQVLIKKLNGNIPNAQSFYKIYFPIKSKSTTTNKKPKEDKSSVSVIEEKASIPEKDESIQKN